MKNLLASTALALLLSSGLAAVPASAAQDSNQLIKTLPGEALPISDYYNQNVVGGFLGVGEKMLSKGEA